VVPLLQGRHPGQMKKLHSTSDKQLYIYQGSYGIRCLCSLPFTDLTAQNTFRSQHMYSNRHSLANMSSSSSSQRKYDDYKADTNGVSTESSSNNHHSPCV
jgi:hypothetical protein